MNRLSQISVGNAERGIAATTVALLLFLAMGIIVMFTNRGLVFEQRTSANQYRYTKAFEAADAGLEWAQASINNKAPVNTSCAVDAAGPSSFRSRFLAVNPGTGVVTPTGQRAMCVISATGYQCSCPTAGNPTVATAPGPAFLVEYANVPAQPGVVRITAHGCTSAAGQCIPTPVGTPDGYAKVTALLGVLPALGTAPAATITAKTTVSWTGAGAGLGVINVDPASNGITINAGGTVTPGSARITTIPGSPPLSSIIENDPSLAAITTDSMFATFFGMSKTQFQQLAKQVTCPANCTQTMQDAISSFGTDTPIIWVTNDLAVTGGPIGTTANPVLLVVNGNIQLTGNIDVTGLVYASSATWNNTGGGTAFLRGAAVTEGSFTGNGSPDFYFDPSVLMALRHVPGAFIKIPGSWKDY